MKEQNNEAKIELADREPITVAEALHRFADRSNRLLMIDIAHELESITEDPCLTPEEKVGHTRCVAESLKKGEMPK